MSGEEIKSEGESARVAYFKSNFCGVHRNSPIIHAMNTKNLCKNSINQQQQQKCHYY